MKKIMIFSTIIILLLCMVKEEQVIIPKEAIRFRIIANSNQEKDQKDKKEVLKEMTPLLMKVEKEDLSKTKQAIKESLPEFEQILKKKNQNYTIHYGKNYFPEKEYKNVYYPEGQYDSLVITLGSGKGENFWCVLFPPLCFLEDDVEYKSIVKEMIEKYF